MADHGHDNCPHCDLDLSGREPVCPNCEGGLFGVPPKKIGVKAKAEQITSKIETEVKKAATVVGEKGGQTVQKMSQTIGDHIIPAWSAVSKTSGEFVDKVKHKSGDKQTDHNVASEETTQPIEDVQLGDTATNIPNTSTNGGGIMDIDSLLSKGELLVSEGREQEALKIFNSVIAEDPSNGMAWFNRGVIHEMSGLVDEAVKAFKVCIDMQPDHGPAAANLAVLLDRQGSSDAPRYAHLGLRSFPSHSELANIASKSPEEFVPTTDNTPAIQPETVPELTEEQVEAVAVVVEQHEFVSEEVADAPIDIDSLVEDAAELVKQSRPEDALELLRELLHGDASEHSRAWRIAAASMAQLSMVDSAIEAFTYALDLDNTDAASWYNLGALYRRNDQEESAVTCFDAALGLRPDYTKASAALAEIHTKNGSLSSAIDAWRCLLEHQPNHEGGVTFAGILIAISEGEGEVLDMAIEIPTTIPEGPELANEALRYIPDNDSPDNLSLRARALTLTGSYPEAVKAWRSLIETDRDNPELWEGMMKTFISAGDQNTADKCRQKIASLSGESESISDANAALLSHATEPEPEPETPEDTIEEQEVVETEEIDEHQTTVSSDDPWADDPWGDADHSDVVEDEEESGEIDSAPEIIAAEEILDSAPEPESSTSNQPEPSPEVDLAKAALETQAQIESQQPIIGSGKIDSSSIANQDVQWYNKGLALLSDEKYQEALSCFDRALPTFVNDDEMIVRILNARGNSFYYLKQFSDCIEAYHKAMQVNPAGVTGATLYNMGTAYAEVERYDDAIKCFEQGMSAKRVNPLTGDQSKMAKEQIRRCKILHKEQKKKLKRFAKLQS